MSVHSHGKQHYIDRRRSEHYTKKAVIPPPEVIADAEKALLYEPDITAFLMGDPPPHRSAH